MYQPDRLPAVLQCLVVVKTHNECECRNPVVLIECLNGRLDYPVPLFRLVWGELAICVLANEPYAARLKTALDANVVIRAGSNYLRYIGDESLICDCTSKRSMSWVCMFYASCHDTLEQLF